MFRPADESQRLPIRRLLAVMLVALVLRLGLGFWLPADAAFVERLPDQAEYLQIAQSVLEGRGFVSIDPRYPTEQTLLAQRMPGYPLFVAACAGSVRAVRIAQALIECSTVLATFLLARRWLRDGPSLLAAALVAVNPFLAYFSILVLSETLFTALVAWGMCGLARPGRRGRLWWLGMAALIASVYVRPSGAGLAIVLALASVFLPGRHPFAVHSRWPLPVGVTAAGLIAIALLPWIARNRLVLGEWVPLTTNGGITLYDGWHPDNTTGGSDQAFVAYMPQLGLMNEVERNTYLRQKALEAMKERPARSVLLALKKAARTWSPLPLSHAGQPLYRTAGLLYAAPLFVLAAVGLLFGDVSRAGRAFLLAPAAYLTLIHMLTVGSLRYRLPAEPALAILAAAGVASLWAAATYWRHRPRRDDDSEGDPAGRGFEVVLDRPPDV